MGKSTTLAMCVCMSAMNLFSCWAKRMLCQD